MHSGTLINGEIVDLPTVSRWFCSVARVAGVHSAHSWHTILFVDMVSRSLWECSLSLPRSAFVVTDLVKLPRCRLMTRNPSGLPITRADVIATALEP